MVDSETTSTDTGNTESTQHSSESTPESPWATPTHIPVDPPAFDQPNIDRENVVDTQGMATDTGETNGEVLRPQRNSDIMTSSQFFEAERRKSGAKPPTRKVPDATEAERRDAKLREMELLDKNRVEVVPARKGTNWTPILIVLGLIVVAALIWSWLS